MTPVYSNKRSHDESYSDEGSSHAGPSTALRDLKRARLSTEEIDGSPLVLPGKASSPHAINRYTVGAGIDNHEYEDRRDADFEDLQYQTADDLQATQLVRQKYNESRDNMPSENGVIEEVVCKNFMCHKYLQVKLGPLINFIIGHNGSGKSAVLTAITLCLGGKASATNRGQSLKDFVKEGEDNASIEVRIKNQGMGAYMPETYGQSIVVERYFNKAGASGFKIKSKTGPATTKTISTKRADLEDIADHFALQIDNPMNVLSQDNARQFLNTSSPAEKYRFFVKGTQLEQLDTDYRLMLENLEQTEVKLLTRQEDLNEKKKQKVEAQKKVEMADQQQTLRERARELRRQMAWIQVIEQETALEAIKDRIKTQKGKAAALIAKAQEAAADYEAANDELEDRKRKLEALKESEVPIKEGSSVPQDGYDNVNAEIARLQVQQRNIHSMIQANDETITSLRQELEQERLRLEGANGGAHARKLSEIDRARAVVVESKSLMDQAAAEAPRLRTAKSEAEAALERKKMQRTKKSDELRAQEHQLQTLRSDQGREMAAFHKQVPALLRAIQNEPRFREKPVGPVGRFVSLKKPEWSLILEKFFGPFLTAFVVTSNADQETLRSLASRLNCPCVTYIGNGRPIDTAGHEPDCENDTILRILKIDNELIRNQFIINHGIEQTVLIQDRQKANDYMCGNTTPANVKQTLSFQTHGRGGFRFTSTRGGDRVDPIEPWTGPPRMKTDLEFQISQLEQDVLMLRGEYNELENQARQLAANYQDCCQAVERNKRRENELRLAHQQAEDRLELLQADLEAETPQDGRLDSLTEQLRDVEEERTVNVAQYDDSKRSMTDLRTQERQLHEELREWTEKRKKIAIQVEKAEKTVKDMIPHREKHLLAKNHAIHAIEDVENERANLQKTRQEQEEVVAEFIEGASRVSARVPVGVGETKQSLEMKMGKLEEELRYSERRLGGSREELIIAAQQASLEYDTAKRVLETLEATAQAIKLACSDRQDRWRKFRRFISSRARLNFTYLLSERDFRGELTTDHKNKLLDIHVEPDITKRSDHGRQTKTLSGGEKSFSTICLLLSLWEAMGSPIRCLDEFDVFMDNVNRDVSMKMMIQAARRSVGRQFILITPQSMNNVGQASDVRIHKMNDPERGQTFLTVGG